MLTAGIAEYRARRNAHKRIEALIARRPSDHRRLLVIRSFDDLRDGPTREEMAGAEAHLARVMADLDENMGRAAWGDR